MRTALVLLILLAAGAAVGSLLPQIPNSPQRVASYQLAHPFFGSLFLRAGFFDVFGSWWFVLILTLLFVSLIACLIPRSRAMIRTIRQCPIQAREIDAFPQYRELRVPADPASAAATARTVLRRHGYRVALAADGRAVAAEKGTLREVGSLVFHWAFLVLLVAVIVGKGTGYVGHATIVEGQTWTDSAFNYDGDLRTGRFSSGSHTGIGIDLLDYSDAFRQSGVPMDFTSKVELFNPDGSLGRTDSVTINHPVSFDGVRIFQFGFGWAPVVTIAYRGVAIFQGPVVTGAWQQCDVDAGLFWSTRTVTCSNGTIVGTAGGPATYTLAQLQSTCPSAVVLAYGVNVGSNNPGWDVETDLFDFNGTVYDFEPYQVAQAKDECKNGGWTSITRADGSSFNNQGDCIQYVNTGK